MGFYYDYHSSNEFFGRSQECHTVEHVLRNNKVSVVHGDSGIGKIHFIQQASYWLIAKETVEKAFYFKTIHLGKHVCAIAPHYTSQKCAACCKIVKKSLSTRMYRCFCGIVANRVHNAALNILRIGMDTLQAST